ncbi:MAG: TonB-dependent receptor [Blastocatellia bacterium]|nr:TonB-dependent receptor [Blastocatellia bacterium]MCS7156263.1 TonB-dependent receptor [Blastocatellia bacterium]MCX7751387.1 TonB-dependent receptor [Blastocatellia bacterium]MDW8169100.1 TonB-dependent receptor [Acidobacteriota bacterium]MDW8255804.1 TonB-dependent receptor [Acidobacteriota bacterium]
MSRIWGIVGLMGCLVYGVGFAQGRMGAIVGRVTDQTGAIVPEAIVQLWEPTAGIHRIARTDGIGDFGFDHLNPGRYRILVSADGFASQSREVVLAAGARLELTFVLSPRPIAEEVVVLAGTIVDTPETLRRIPGSVEILDRQVLDASHVFTINEALRKVTGVFARDEEGFGLRPNIGIRGLNPTRSTKVLLLEDGIPLTYAPYGDNASYYHPPVDRFESIEVIKGSGQILYGPMTIGGVINYITPNPPEKSRGALTLMGGNRDYLDGHLSYGGTWGGTGLLLDYMRKQGEGSRDNTRTGLNDANLKLVTALGSKHALTIKGNYYGENSQVTYSGLRLDEYLANPRQNPFLNDRFVGDRYGASVTHAYILKNEVVLTTSLYGSMFFRDWWRQSSNSNQRPNRRGDPGCRGMEDLLTTCGNEGRLRKYYTWGIEPRIRAFDRILGIRGETEFGFRAHFERQDRRQMNGQAPTARTGALVEDNERKNQAYSGFIQHRFLLGRWTLTPGLRLEHVRYERTNRLANRGAGATGRTHLTEVIPGIGITFAPASHTTIFGGAHRGFAPPRTEDIIDNAGGTIDLDPERSWTYEVGVRSWPVSGLKLEATFFRMDFENQIVPASVAGGIGATFTNAGETLHQGMEFTGRVDMGSLLNMTHNVYVRTAYTYIPTAKFVGRRFSSIPGFSTVSVSGNRLPYAPKHLMNFQLGYAHPRGLDALLEAVHVSDQFGDDLNTIAPTPDGQRGLLPAYTIWNLTLNYRVESRGLTFFVTVKNLFDRLYIADRTRGILPGPPRLVHGGLRFQF